MIKLFILIIFLGCETSQWTDIEKKEFNGDCLDAEYTKQACDCILNCLEIEYQNYKIMLDEILEHSISINLNTCIKKCNENN